jgi:hypothetical protein
VTTPQVVLQAFLVGEEVPEADLLRAQTFLLYNIAKECEHLCGNLQALMRAQGVEVADPTTEETG